MGQPDLARGLLSTLVELPQRELQQRQAIGGLGVGEQSLAKLALDIRLKYQPGRRCWRAHNLGQFGWSGWAKIETRASLLQSFQCRLLQQQLVEVSTQCCDRPDPLGRDQLPKALGKGCTFL